MKTYYIFRHGKAIQEGEIYGEKIYSASLLEEGRETVEKLAEFIKTLPKTTNISSEVLRCRQTAQIVTAITGREFIFDSRINEYHDESFEQFKNRIQSFLDEVKDNKKPLLLCTHGAVIAALKHLILTNDFEEKDQFDFIDPAELLIINENNIEVKRFN